MNIKLLNFALTSLKRKFAKNIIIFFILSFLVFAILSIFLVANSIKKELFLTVDELPDIVVQKVVGGRLVKNELDKVFEIENIKGVSGANPRVWGYYYFQVEGVNFSIVGLDFNLDSFKKTYNDIIKKYQDVDDENFAIVGEGVKKILEKNFYKDYFNFITPNGEFLKVKILGTFKSSSLQTYDTIVMPIELAKKILDYNDDEITDIVVNVPNKDEIFTIKQKLKLIDPSFVALSKEDIKIAYQNIFDYKSGIFLSLMLSSFIAFFILILDKSSLSFQEKKEISILKAIGWSIEDILKLKFIESFIIGFFSFLIGVMISYFYVYILKAPIIKDIFAGFSKLKPPFDLIPVFDKGLIFSIFIFVVVVFIFATIIPNWKASITPPEDSLR